MAIQLFKNNASSNISGSLSSGATTLVLASGTGNAFPSPTGSDYFLVTLFEKDQSGIEKYVEVVKVTARTADTLTIVRDFENMTGIVGGHSYPSLPSRTVYVELRWTSAGANNYLQKSDNLASLTDAVAARTNLGLGSSAVEPSTTFALSATTLTAGTGLTGGGTLAANRSLSIANTAVTVGAYGSATQVGTFTVNAQGQLTAASNVTITPAFSSVTGKPTTLSGYGITDAQPLDADLTAIAALTGTSGLLTTNGLGTWTIDTNTYLTTGSASSTYLTQAAAATTYQPVSARNAVNGYAGLDGSGKIAAAQLPSYVDDVLEYANYAALPVTGEAGKIYIALDTNKQYRWGGTVYIEVSASPGSTDAVTEGVTNLYYTNARARAAVSATQNLTYNSATGVFTGPDLSSYLTSATASGTYAPISTTVTLTGTQTLTNKTFTGYTETVYNLTGTDINPANGTIQYKTLGANTTFTESLADGQCVTLMLNPATYTVTWPTTTWVGSVASTAPTLVASVYNCITFFQIAGTLYGKYEGRV